MTRTRPKWFLTDETGDVRIILYDPYHIYHIAHCLTRKGKDVIMCIQSEYNKKKIQYTLDNIPEVGIIISNEKIEAAFLGV